MPRPTRWKGCVNGLKGRVRACFICPPIRLTSTPSKWPAPKLSSSCARLKRALWKHSMRRLLRPYKLFLRAMLKASSSMSDSVYDPYGNRYMLRLSLHPLGDDFESQGTAQRANRLDNRHIIGITRDVAHKRAVDLEPVDRQVFQDG